MTPDPQGALTPRHANRITTLTIVTERLAALVAEETEHLRHRRASGLRLRQDEKAKLIRAYEAESASLRANRAPVDSAAPEERADLKAAVATLQARLEENRILVAALKEVTEGVINAVAQEVARMKRPVLCYGANAAPSRGRAPAATPIAHNETV